MLGQSEQEELASSRTLEELDRRLMGATERMCAERLEMERQNAQLRALVIHYSAVVEQLEAEMVTISATASNRAHIKDTLRQLSERSAVVAASL